MFRKGMHVFLKNVDNKFYEVTIQKKQGVMYDVSFQNGDIVQCHEKFIMKQLPTKKSNKYIKKLQHKKVDFGKYKESNMTYKTLLEREDEYCKAILKGFYNVPNDFKTFCCDSLIL